MPQEQRGFAMPVMNSDPTCLVSSEDELLRLAPLPHERVVYWGSGSPQGRPNRPYVPIVTTIWCCWVVAHQTDMLYGMDCIAWRILIALEEKQLPYRSVCVSFSSGVLKSPFFRALNPRMRIPVLVEPIELETPGTDDKETDNVTQSPTTRVAEAAVGMSRLMT